VSCGQGQKNGNAITVTLAQNQTITCTFTNFKKNDDPMGQVANAFVSRRVDNLLTYGPDRARLLRRLESQDPDPGLKDTGPLKLTNEPALGDSRVGQSGFDRFRFGQPGLGQMGPGLNQADANQPLIGSSDWQMAQRPDDSRLGAFSMLGASTNFATQFKFSTSLSELQASAQALEDQKLKAQEGELGFLQGRPYTRPTNTLKPGLDIWAEGQLSFYQDGTGGLNRDGRFGVLYIGADYPLSTRILFGTLVQFDWTTEKIKDPVVSGDVGGNGWMAGPYLGVKLTPNLLFDTRIAWGKSQNDITLTDPSAGTRTGSFDTTRWLATANLTGNYFYGPWRLSPQAGLAYGHEGYGDFSNSLGQTVSGSEVSIARATLGSEVGYRFMLRNGLLVEPHVGLTGIWNFNSDDLVINGVVVTPSGTRAKVEGGVILKTPAGPSMRAAVSYDGIGDSDFSAVAGQVWINVPFQ
jgi:outer membrane autotransporter protein